MSGLSQEDRQLLQGIQTSIPKRRIGSWIALPIAIVIGVALTAAIYFIAAHTGNQVDAVSDAELQAHREQTATPAAQDR